VSCCDDCCGRESILDRIRGWFRRKNCDDCCNGCYVPCGHGCCAPAAAPAAEPIAPPKEAPKKMPEGGEAPMQQVNAIETETKNPFELHRRYESRVAHAPDYGCLTGQLFYVHADGGLWVLRYAPLWKEDRYGGSMVLARDLRMENFKEGDLVTVHGEILNQRSSVYLGGPLYRAHSIQLVDRSE
jgi:hypothetical protein